MKGGLGEELTETLTHIATHIPSLLPSIQAKLLDDISLVLSDKPFSAFSRDEIDNLLPEEMKDYSRENLGKFSNTNNDKNSKNKKNPSPLSISPFPSQRDIVESLEEFLNPNKEKKEASQLVLALKILGNFDFKPHSLSNFISDCIIHLVDHHSA